jgi:hypothetical protein
MNSDNNELVNTLANELKNSYRKWKSAAYYDPFLAIDANRIAYFEFENKLREENNTYFLILANELLNKKKREKLISSIIDQISVRCFPKTNSILENHYSENIISNLPPSMQSIDKIQYMIDVPIIGHILSVLWILKFGKLLDNDFGTFLYGDRIRDIVKQESEKSVSAMLFYPYFSNYESWRDEGIKEIEKLLDNNKNALMISLDISGYYYNCRINFDRLRDSIKSVESSENNKAFGFLTDFIEKVFIKYSSFFKFENNPDDNPMLPIGFLPSKIISNWYLINFDRAVISKLNPIYYGRYVDDILIVFEDSANNIEQLSSANIISNKLIFPANIFIKRTNLQNRDQIEYEINEVYTNYSPKRLKFGQEKTKTFFFNHKYSRELINNFKENIAKNSSAFNLLHEEDELLENFSNNVLKIKYSDTLNKIRSIEDIHVDKHNLSIWLSYILYYSGNITDNQMVEYSKIFFQITESYGTLFIFTFWEKLLTFFFKHQEYKGINQLVLSILKDIESIDIPFKKNQGWYLIDNSNQVMSQEKLSLASTLTFYLRAVLEKIFSLRYEQADQECIDYINELLTKKGYLTFRPHFRQAYLSSFMFMNTLVTFPLKKNPINIPVYDLLTVTHNFYYKSGITDYSYLNLYPRYVHFHEVQLLILGFPQIANLFNRKKKFDYAWALFWWINYQKTNFEDNPIKVEPIKKTLKNDTHKVYTEKVTIGDSINIDKVKIGVANVIVSNENYEQSLLGKSNFNKSSRIEASKIVNQAIEQNVNLLTLPECYINYSWVNKLIYVARKKQMGIIFGLEYIINSQKQVNNYLVCILPFKLGDYENCAIDIRLKNHYSPKEISEIQDKQLSVPIQNLCSYVMYKSLGMNFAPYICFEISSLEDRSVFKSDIDAVVVSEWNKDIEYFSNIIESLSRDLHCYCIQVNSSEYGDSRITQPKKSYLKDILKAKGGKNSYLIVDEINIKELREYQQKPFEDQMKASKSEDSFRPIPPDFDQKRARNR